MRVIIVEGALFVALVVVLVLVVRTIVRHHTAIGTRLEQTENRRAIEQAVGLTCERHGPHEARAMVRLRSGDLMCPECYEDTVRSVL